MTYKKPEISILGDAAHVIQLTGDKVSDRQTDPISGFDDFNPAYDLDE